MHIDFKNHEVSVLRSPIRRLRIFVASGLALFILFAPGARQVTGIEASWLRPWTMYSTAGTGILKGSFEARSANGELFVLSPLEVLGTKTYPVIASYDYVYFVRDEHDIAVLARGFCLREPVDLAFAGHVGTRRGWREIAARDLCRLTMSNVSALGERHGGAAP